MTIKSCLLRCACRKGGVLVTTPALLYLEVTSTPHGEVPPPLLRLEEAVVNASHQLVLLEPPVLQENNLFLRAYGIDFFVFVFGDDDDDEDNDDDTKSKRGAEAKKGMVNK